MASSDVAAAQVEAVVDTHHVHPNVLGHRTLGAEFLMAQQHRAMVGANVFNRQVHFDAKKKEIELLAQKTTIEAHYPLIRRNH